MRPEERKREPSHCSEARQRTPRSTISSPITCTAEFTARIYERGNPFKEEEEELKEEEEEEEEEVKEEEEEEPKEDE